MSHTATIDAVVISDEHALRAAITELKNNGVNCDLLENAMARAYYPNQSGMDTEARFVVKLHDSRYDVGLYAKEDNSGYEARTDLWGGDVQKVLGAKAQEGESDAQAALGKLFQTYAIHAATRKATQQGYRVNRVTKDDGTVQLQIAV